VVGVSWAPWYAIYPFVLGVNTNGVLSSRLMCVCGRGALSVSVGKKQVCVPACCIVLRYKLHEFVICIGG